MTPDLLRSFCLGTLLFIIFTSASIAGGTVRVFRQVDASNMRQINQACMIYAGTHDGHFPDASDIWDYARILADEAGLDDARMWTSKIDPAFGKSASGILIKSSALPHRLTPEFRQIKLSVAIAVGNLSLATPATTPILWTRGLQPDGTWATHSPYGNKGGYIMFVGGHGTFFKNLTDSGEQLLRFDGKGTTSNILEAIPPGSRILEYVPTADEQAAWSKVERILSEPVKRTSPLVGMVIIWIPFLGVSIYRSLAKKPGVLTVLVWPLLLSILLSIIVPTVS
ncbi:MAG: hypothetical protein K0R17_1939 [Rariglobus sp.]|jgi:hypothetical protein|nr:hypothetical protein [Rariglobus sp.]